MSKKEKSMLFWQHLEELRWSIFKILGVLVITTAISLIYVDDILEILMFPLNTLLKNSNVRLNQAGPFDGVFIKMKTGILGGIILGAPFAFWFIWSFVSPGLKKNEIKTFLPLCIAGTFFFLLGGILGYWTLPVVLPVLVSFSVNNAENIWVLKEYIDFLFYWILCAGFLFEIPILLIILTKLGFIRIGTLRKGRPYAIVAAFVLAAVITPSPDAVTQMIVGVPIILLYEIGIFLASFQKICNSKQGD